MYSREVHKFCYRHRAWGYGEEWLTYWYHILLTDIMPVSKPFFTVTQCCCPRGKSKKYSRTNLKSLSNCPWTTNPCPCPRTSSPWLRRSPKKIWELLKLDVFTDQIPNPPDLKHPTADSVILSSTGNSYRSLNESSALFISLYTQAVFT